MKQFVHSLAETLRNAKDGQVDRPEVVAHATLTGLLQHWPKEPLLCELAIPELLEKTSWVRTLEPSRWMKQRRIGLAKLARLSWEAR